MRTVFSNHELPHVWANQLQENGRNANNSFFFNSSGIYSYGHHFCIAKFLNNETVLITDRSYSNTTTKHVSKVMAAISHKKRIYCPHPESENENFIVWQERIKEELTKLSKAKKPEIYISNILVIQEQVKKYCFHLGINVPYYLSEYFNQFENEETKNNYLGKIREKEKERKKKEQETINKQLIDWRNNEIQSFTFHNDNQFLRINGENIETSKGIKFPKNLAFQVYEHIKKGVKGSKVLNYSITEKTDKFVRIGCHKLTFSEIESILNILK